MTDLRTEGKPRFVGLSRLNCYGSMHCTHDRGIMKREEKFLGLVREAFVDEIWGPNDGHDYA